MGLMALGLSRQGAKLKRIGIVDNDLKIFKK